MPSVIITRSRAGVSEEEAKIGVKRWLPGALPAALAAAGLLSACLLMLTLSVGDALASAGTNHSSSQIFWVLSSKAQRAGGFLVSTQPAKRVRIWDVL